MRATSSTIRDKPVPTLQSAPVRRLFGRPAEARSDLFLLQLRRAAGQEGANANVLCADAGDARGQFFQPCHANLRPVTRTAAGTCTFFAGNRIPANRLDPIAVALLAKVPLPTGDGAVQNLLAVDDQVNPMNQFSLKVDHRLGASDYLYAPCDVLPRGRHTTIRNDVVERGPGSGLWAKGHHSQRECRGRSYAYLQFSLAERGSVRLPARTRWTGQPEPGRRFRRQLPDFRA